MLLKVVPLMVALPKPRFVPIELLMLMGVPLIHGEQLGFAPGAAPVDVTEKSGPSSMKLVLPPEIPTKTWPSGIWTGSAWTDGVMMNITSAHKPITILDVLGMDSPFFNMLEY